MDRVIDDVEAVPRGPLAPLWRTVDGRPGDSRETVARRLRVLTIVATGIANLVGALVVLALTRAIPNPEGVPDGLHTANDVLFTSYVALAVPTGLVLGARLFRRVLRAVTDGGPEPGASADVLLYAPVRLMAVHLTLWTVGTVGWVVINAPFSPMLAVKLGLISFLGGLSTCAIVYLLTERLLRRAVTGALRERVPPGTGLPGIVARTVLAWALGTAVPVLGLLVLAVSALVLDTVGVGEFAVAALMLGTTSLVVGFGVTFSAARAIAAPVESVRQGLARVERGDLDVAVPVYDATEIGRLQAGFNHMAAGLREHERLRDLFGRHVGADVARVAMEGGIEQEVELGGEQRKVAVLFVDVIGSTRLAAERPPTEVVALLNRFFAIVVETVGEHGGWINKFEGDAALAVFGAPLELPGASGRALAAAREMAARLADGVPGLGAAVGVSAGEAVAGNVGARERFEYTVIGDPVNEAARLTDLAKTVPGRVLAAASVVAEAGEEAAHWTLGDEVVLRGRLEPTRLATVVADVPAG